MSGVAYQFWALPWTWAWAVVAGLSIYVAGMFSKKAFVLDWWGFCLFCGIDIAAILGSDGCNPEPINICKHKPTTSAHTIGPRSNSSAIG